MIPEFPGRTSVITKVLKKKKKTRESDRRVQVRKGDVIPEERSEDGRGDTGQGRRCPDAGRGQQAGFLQTLHLCPYLSPQACFGFLNFKTARFFFFSSSY